MMPAVSEKNYLACTNIPETDPVEMHMACSIGGTAIGTSKSAAKATGPKATFSRKHPDIGEN